ncbi:DUF1963 domain-containing protein [Actinospica sp. MGRD01-02]|uniref:DUF1963 domain-containing protein n=1 Tax=Actinospica acidithermotolerans TaxID=2828514 RepID=A0A941EC66_9ACTN|nr:DUF1963 domain-containing protein [Actinospica acidithermotolerans]MBR7827782.1 DUF1963 domain-containing protein [Actinospica acidithermotolerans]
MYFDDDAVLRLSVERLGKRARPQFADLARRGFLLEEPTEHAAASGACRLGGPALLEPGTAWPRIDGFALSLLAVLDTGILADRLDAPLPETARGLLNFFYADPDVPFETWRQLDFSSPHAARVVAADPALAVEVAAPAPARAYPPTPVHASAVAMLPDSWDVQDGDIEFDTDMYWGAPAVILEVMRGHDGNTGGRHTAFGWPDTSYGNTVTARDAEGPAVHLLQLSQDARLGWSWGDAATLYFTIPAGAFAAGDLTAARAIMQSC